jgi:hypothetical protein
VNPTIRFTVFSTDGSTGGKNLKCVYWISMFCLWSNQSELMALFIVLIYVLVMVFYLSFKVNF